jgi:hypothetical protein
VVKKEITSLGSPFCSAIGFAGTVDLSTPGYPGRNAVIPQCSAFRFSVTVFLRRIPAVLLASSAAPSVGAAPRPETRLPGSQPATSPP